MNVSIIQQCRAGIRRLAGMAIMVVVASFTTMSAQISGVVLDTDDEPLVGVSVIVQGTKTGTTTGLDGEFSLPSAKVGDKIKFNYIGYESQVIEVKSSDAMKVVMRETSEQLSEVVVVGYGTLEKKQVTSAITSIKGDQLMAGVGGSTLATALQGKVNGMTISGTASPNSSDGFQMRGVASVNAGKSPLVVIDGVPGGDIRMINWEDVESIDVLKDSSAGAIYGTRAAAGVILITTKKAKEGNVKVDFNMELSTEQVRKRIEVLSASEFTELGIGPDYGYDTDWFKEMTNDNPFSQRYSLTLNGGWKNMAIYASLSYSDQKGIVIGDSRKDYSGRLNGRFNLFGGRVELGINTQIRRTDRDQRIGSSTFAQVIRTNPTLPVMSPFDANAYNVDALGFTPSDYNPVADVMLRDNHGQDNWSFATVNLKVKVWDGLSVHGNVGWDYRHYQSYNYYHKDHRTSLENNRSGYASHGFSKTEYYTAEAYANYIKDFGNHSINAVAGWSFWQNSGESFSLNNSDFIVDGVGGWNISAGSWLLDGRAGMSSDKDPRDRLVAFFGRVNYSYDDRYMASASIRHEGSSKFGKNHKWGDFWSLSAGWRISREAFMRDIDWISDLKIRVGYGVTGNNSFGSGYTTRTYTSYSYWPINGNWIPTYMPKVNVNPNLKWEEKSELNVGIDYGFLNGRLYGKIDYYRRQVDDLLFSGRVSMPPYIYGTMMQNLGSLTNTGWEAEIGGDILRGANGLRWSAALRASQNFSKVKNLGDAGSYVLPSSMTASMGYYSKIEEGARIGRFWLYKSAGLDENGKWLIYDKDNKVVPAEGNLKDENKHYMGNGVPRIMLSMEHNLQYKGFDLGINLRAWLDYDVFSQTMMMQGLKGSGGGNVLKAAYTDNYNVNSARIASDYFLYDASFLKIDAITLGYTWNASKATKGSINTVRPYVTVRDVATWTKYKGYNPEQNVNGLFPGLESYENSTSLYPQTRRWTIGVQVSF